MQFGSKEATVSIFFPRLYMKSELKWWQRLMGWFIGKFRKSTYPIAFRNAGISPTLFEGELMNESGKNGNIIRGPYFSLDWEDVKHLPCSNPKCQRSIPGDVWSLVGALFSRGKPVIYYRYCQSCTSEMKTIIQLLKFR